MMERSVALPSTTSRPRHVSQHDLCSFLVYKAYITSGTDITPVSGSNLYFGFGGVAVDLKTPGTIMVAALNSWWPDGQIYRSTDSGASWTPLWDFSQSPIAKYYSYSDSLAPWIGPDYVSTVLGTLQIGWMMEGTCLLSAQFFVVKADERWMDSFGDRSF